MPPIKKTVVEWLNDVDYADDILYVPNDFALEFVNFIKVMNGNEQEEHKTPVVHYRMMDQVAGPKENIINLCSRGLAKTTLMCQYLILYIAVYGEIPGYGKIDYALYVADAIENNVKKMRLRLEMFCTNKPFLKTYLEEWKFTDVRWYFKNKEGKEFVVTGHGAKSGVRGTVELGTRPQLALLDDLLSDDDAKSPTIIKSIENTVYKAIEYALHPQKRKTIWSGTPFNAKDPLYKAVESGAWYVNVYPVCNEFPCARENFKGAWPDRFDYDYVKKAYTKALSMGELASFNQELMLRIMSEEDRLILDADIRWYRLADIKNRRAAFNFYITTDFATSENTASDNSVIMVWAVNSKGWWFLVDGVCKRQLMDKNIDDLFRLAQLWKPQQVGIEVSGQQGGFIPWIQREMVQRNVWFTLASENNNGKLGIRPVTNKMMRFNIVVPWFKAGQIHFPEELRTTPLLLETTNELSLASPSAFRAKHDDCIDTISMLGSLTIWLPSEDITMVPVEGSNMWEMEDDDSSEITGLNSYIV
jgi:predicted phage terminase large subunit-like protein